MQNVEHILVVRLTALGDLVLIEPAVRALREKFPEARVDLVTEARYASLARATFSVGEVIGYDRRGEDRGLAGMKRALARLPAQTYDVVVDLQGKPRTRLFAFRVPARERIVLSKRSPLEGLRALFGKDPPIADRHASTIFLEALAPLGISTDGAPRAPKLRRPEPLALDPRDDPRDEDALVIGLAPGASQATKRWPIDRFAELADRLAAEHPRARFLFIGGPEDRELLDQLRVKAKAARFFETDVTALDPLGLARALSALDLMVAADTGPAHLAAAFGVPVVAIFGPTSPVRWGPIGPRHRIATLSLDCAPCTNFGGDLCPLDTRSHECMQALSTDLVFQSARELLAGPRT